MKIFNHRGIEKKKMSYLMGQAITSLILCLFFVSVPLCAEEKINSAQRAVLIQAQNEMAEGKYSLALQTLKNFIKEHRVHSIIYMKTAQCQRELNQLAQAEENYLLALKLSPKLKVAFQNLAKLYFDSERYSEAASYFIKSSDSKPFQLNQIKNIAISYLRADMLRPALKAFEEGLLYYPRDMDIRRGSVQCLIQLEDYSSALSSCQDALKINPLDLKLRELLGDIQAYSAKVIDSINTYESLLLFSPENHRSRVKLARLYASQSMFREAVKHFIFLDKKNQLKESEKGELSRVYFHAKDLKQCLSVLESLSKKEMSDELELLKAQAYFEIKDFDKAINTYRSLSQKNNLSGRVHYHHALCAKALKLPQEARQAYEKCTHFPQYRLNAIQALIGLALDENKQAEVKRLLGQGLKEYPEDTYFLQLKKYYQR